MYLLENRGGLCNECVLKPGCEHVLSIDVENSQRMGIPEAPLESPLICPCEHSVPE